MNFRRAVDVQRWGQLETWEAIDAAYILGGTEPDRGPNATLPNKATAALEAIRSAMLVGELVPFRIAPNGEHYLLAAEVVHWATSKRFDVPAGLASAVHATTSAYLARHKAAKASAGIEQADAIPMWLSKDLWSEDELAGLLCGFVHDQQVPTDQARRAVQLGVAAGKLDAILVQQPGCWEQMYADSRTDRFFKPADAIAWALNRRAEFPLFPAFSLLPDGGENSATVAAPSGPAEKGRGSQNESTAGQAWEPGARKLAEQYVAAWIRAGYEPTVADAALYVEGRLSTEGITGARGFLDRETIRKALVGITGRKPGERMVNKKIPTNLRETMPN